MEPLCLYFSTCGDCTLQQTDYSTQLKNKVKIVKELLKIDTVEIFNGEPYFYRNRMDFLFTQTSFGLRKKR